MRDTIRFTYEADRYGAGDDEFRFGFADRISLKRPHYPKLMSNLCANGEAWRMLAYCRPNQSSLAPQCHNVEFKDIPSRVNSRKAIRNGVLQPITFELRPSHV